MSSPSSFLDMYEPLDVIGNGSFGIIRKVRRKADGTTFARKELNFEKMSERDRKQIVAEVNILKELNHEHIVRYIDRCVDRDAGILYILMEYCGGGDLSTVIKQAAKYNRPIPEDTIWNYFMQILLALHHCHHPNGHARSNSSGGGVVVMDGNANAPEGSLGGGRDRKVQILHRDLKPDNVFLDDNNCVKLGDFGLSKALAQASFANTYVGTPYYMSPELMQEKAYDSKSDIWSLGCLIYELCALKPPFHEAKTHAELSICIRNGRIPPLPRGYSQALSNVIKSMLNLNPAMRPSAAQLLQHERLELVFKVSETEKMLATVKAHKTAMTNKERELLTREATLHEREKQLSAIVVKKDAEITSLQKHLAQFQQQAESRRYTQQDVELAVRNAVARREEELRIAVMQREGEVKAAMAKREEEIMEAVRKRENEVCEAWVRREAEIAKEVQTRIQDMEQRADAIRRKEEELKAEEVRLNNVREKFEDRVDDPATARKTPLEEVKNLLTPLARPRKTASKERVEFDSMPTPKAAAPAPHTFPLETPESRAMFGGFIPSAMKGVVLTSTGEVLETPTPTELANIFKISPKVGLNFANIFDPNATDKKGLEFSSSEGEDDTPPPSPSSRKQKERLGRASSSGSSSTSSNSAPSTSNQSSNKKIPKSAQPPTRLRKPSIRTSAINGRPSLTRTATAPVVLGSAAPVTGRKSSIPSSASSAPSATSSSSSSTGSATAQKAPPNANTVTFPAPVQQQQQQTVTCPEYNLDDEDGLPSPFLKRAERERAMFSAAEDEENLPSPFLKRAERERVTAVTAVNGGKTQPGGVVKVPSGAGATTAGGQITAAVASTAIAAAANTNAGMGMGPGTGTGTVTKKRPNSGNMLRAMAAANNVAGRRGTTPTPAGPSSPTRSSAARAAQIQANVNHHTAHPDGRLSLPNRRTSDVKVLTRS